MKQPQAKIGVIIRRIQRHRLLQIALGLPPAEIAAHEIAVEHMVGGLDSAGQGQHKIALRIILKNRLERFRHFVRPVYLRFKRFLKRFVALVHRIHQHRDVGLVKISVRIPWKQLLCLDEVCLGLFKFEIIDLLLPGSDQTVEGIRQLPRLEAGKSYQQY